jgi:hypothetical protein
MTTGIVRSRHTIRKNPPSNRVPVYVEPWTFAEDAKHLAPIEKAFRDALEVVDLIEARKTTAKQSGQYTDEGVAADALTFAAATLAPRDEKGDRGPGTPVGCDHAPHMG